MQSSGRGFCLRNWWLAGLCLPNYSRKLYYSFYRNDSHKTAETMRLLIKLDEGLIYQYGYQLFCILQSAWAIFISTDDVLPAYQGGL